MIKRNEQGHQILAETLAIWPHLGECRNCELKLQSKASVFLEVYYYSTKNYEKWTDLEGNNVREHEMHHVNSYMDYWNSFTIKANLHEKKYKNHKECLTKLKYVSRVYQKVINLANKAQVAFDKKVYPKR